MNELIDSLLREASIPFPAIILEYYRALGLSLEELLLVLQLVHSQGKLEIAAERMGVPIDTATVWVNRLMERRQLTLETTTNNEGKIDVVYSSQPLMTQLASLLVKEATAVKTEAPKPSLDPKDLVNLFEQEFGRPLSSMELEMISQWVQVDRYSADLIRLALREAVLNRALNMKYVDRVLLNWEKKNITTPQQVEEEGQKYRKRQDSRYQEAELDDATSQILLQGWSHD